MVAHADILWYISGGYKNGGHWANAEVREYTFNVEEEDDADGEAWLKGVRKVAKKGAEEPSSSDIAR